MAAAKKKSVKKSARKTVKKKVAAKKPKKKPSGKSTKGKTGRPKKEIDWDEFEKLCGILCTKEEICDWFSLSDRTLSRHIREIYDDSFDGVYKKLSAPGKISIRRAQFQSATIRQNTTMLIWLGKQYLGQSDKMTDPSNSFGEIQGWFKNMRQEYDKVKK